MEYTVKGEKHFFTDRMAQDAVVRNFEIIGEATKQISQQLRDTQPDIPWRKMAGLRDVLIHNYMGVDISEVWQIITNELPNLSFAINSLLDK